MVEVAEILIPIILQALEAAIYDAIKEGITYIIKKVVDAAGNVVTQIVYEFDSDGDGVNDSEQIIYTLDTIIPSLDNGYCLCNKGNEIGLGLPQYEIVDGTDIADLIDTKVITGNNNGFIIDLDNDGAKDDVLIPLPDFTGDGLRDWGWLVDRDDNGLPDVSPFAPFYPIGSEEYHYIIEQSGLGDNGIMTKSVDDYTVTEGLLALILLFTAINFVRGLFRRKDIYR